MSNDNIAKISIIEGDSIETIGGTHTEYVGKIIYSSSQKLFATAENGKFFGDNPDDPPKTEGRIIDVVMFVAGTTDPINTTGKKHQANTDYWRSSKENFWHKIKDLKLQFLDLHIEGDFFSWSGDNDTNERNTASERLFDLILRLYPSWKKEEVHLHLIGHSHGGNVINQFTNLIASKDMIAKSSILKPRKITEFPALWKIKSITYLSTPFFQKKHQLNHSKVHKNCKIINVHNEYDLTQQLIADFSLVNLEGLLKSFQMEKFKKGIDILKSVNKDIITKYLKGIGLPESHKKRAIPAWKEMSNAFLGINIIIKELINYINSLKIENSNLQKEKKEFISLLNKLLQWSYDVHSNYYVGISKGFDKSTWAKNLNLTQGLKILNILFDIKSDPKDSYLLKLLAGIFGESKGITDSIDETSWSPKKQAKNLQIIPVKITNSDLYNSRNKKKQFDIFLKGVQNAVNTNNLEDLLMRLFSQFINPNNFSTIINVIDWGVEPLVFGNLDTEVTILRKNFEVYSEFITKYNANLVTENDKKQIDDLVNRPGSIPYLAMTSHSLSHTQFWPDVEKGLRSAFSSGENPKYKKK